MIWSDYILGHFGNGLNENLLQYMDQLETADLLYNEPSHTESFGCLFLLYNFDKKKDNLKDCRKSALAMNGQFS